MNCDDVQQLLVDFEEGRLEPGESDEVRRHLETCAACAREHAAVHEFAAVLRRDEADTPGGRVRERFNHWLETEMEAQTVSRVVAFKEPGARWLHPTLIATGAAVAACAIFAFGVHLGGRHLSARLTAERESTARELAELRRHVEVVDRTVAFSMWREGTASDRLKAVLAVDRASGDPRVVEELLGVLAFDGSSSVRLTAVEALLPHAADAGVMGAVARALSRESSPVVQLAIIDLLATTREPAAVTALEQFITSDSAVETVRNAARYALTRM